jgi:hypothetical protein
MREKHCAFAILNYFGRCIAQCWRNQEAGIGRDCTGLDAKDESDEREFLQEVRLSRGNKI